MTVEDSKETFATQEKISNVILFFLLLVRLIDQNLAVWIFGAKIPNWFPYWYAGILYILIVVVVWLNRHRLVMLNIDRPFMIALILGGLLYAFHLTLDIGIFVGIATGFVYWAYQGNHFCLKNSVRYPPGTVWLMFLLVLLALLPVFIYTPTFKTSLNVQSVIASLFQTQLALIVFEEILFRGAFWAYLRERGLRERAAFSLPAILFWISHHRFLLLSDQYFFWIVAPLVSILLGLLAWRSKSLTPSTISHFLFNFTTALLKNIF